jgi:Leu/Phe-tRNA-protein transferase
MVQESEISDTDEDVPEVIRLERWYLSHPKILQRICLDMSHHLYLTDEWTTEFYVAQAYEGFVAVAFEDMYMLPELQKKYCILQFADLKLAGSFLKNVRKIAKTQNLTLTFNTQLERVLSGIQTVHKDKNWLKSRYRALAHQLIRAGEIAIGTAHFRFLSVELWRGDELVAGEVGYAIGGGYTSLTGFCVKGESKVSYGLVQMAALCRLLEQSGFSFWNLGHPPRKDAMQYKAALGGVVISREAFLARWRAARDLSDASPAMLSAAPADAAALIL